MNINLSIKIRKRQNLRNKYLKTKHEDNQRNEEKFMQKKKICISNKKDKK